MNPSFQQWLGDTLAVLVLYKTSLEKSIAFQSLQEVSGHQLQWFIYDNSPEAQPIDSTASLTYQHDKSNAGVSKAYNTGFLEAKKLGKKWLLLLDQDTHFTIDALEAYYQAFLSYPHESCFIPQLRDKHGIISPFRFRLGNGIRIKSVKEGIHEFEKLQFVNSGLMVSVQAFRASGGYDQDFPLDYSDFAFIERLKLKCPSFVVIALTLNHGFSSSMVMPEEDALHRFKLYLHSAALFKEKYYPGSHLLVIRTWLRAMKLSVQYRTLKFISAIL